MIPLHDDDRDPLQVWKRSLPEDEPPPEDRVIHGKRFSKILGWIVAVLLTVAFWIFVFKQWLGL